MNEQSMRFRVGVFVLAALILLAVLVTLFGRLPTLFTKHTQYTIAFRSAPGVGPGTPVRRSGVAIGEVESLSLDDETGNVRINIRVNKDHAIREGDQAVLNHGIFGGDATIDLKPPQPTPEKAPAERPPLAPGAELQGQEQTDVNTLLSEGSKVLPSTEETLDEIRKTLKTFEPLAPQMEDALKEYRELAKDSRQAIPDLRRTNDEVQTTVRNWGKLGERIDVLLQTNQDKLVKTLENLNDTLVRVGNTFSDENQKNLTATLKNVRASSNSLESLTKNTDEMIKDTRETVRRVNTSIAQADEVMANLQQATKPMAERSSSVMKNLDESTDKLNQVLTSARGLLQGGTGGDGTLGRFLNDPSLYNNLNDAACTINQLMPRMDRVLHDVEVFADKIARHPESLGIRGAVSPSKGLKEAPVDDGYWPGH